MYVSTARSIDNKFTEVESTRHGVIEAGGVYLYWISIFNTDIYVFAEDREEKKTDREKEKQDAVMHCDERKTYIKATRFVLPGKVYN